MEYRLHLLIEITATGRLEVVVTARHSIASVLCRIEFEEPALLRGIHELRPHVRVPRLGGHGLSVNPDLRVLVDILDYSRLLDQPLHARHGRVIHPLILLVRPIKIDNPEFSRDRWIIHA